MDKKFMDDKKSNSAPPKGLTMLEMIISLSIIAVLFAVILPQFKNIENSWASKRSTADAIQNGRILIEYLTHNLAKAIEIIVVSDPCDTTGYIEFKGNDSVTYRFDITAGNCVEFGPIGNLSEIGGPVSQMQFTCYDAEDLDTPITTVGDIRSVHVQITITNGGGRDQTYTTWAYLRTNASEASSGLIAHWKFDEGSDTVATDSGPNGHNGTIYNSPAWITGDSCVWMDGATQTALYFDGDDDYVGIDSEITEEYPELTIAMWLKYVGTVITTHALFASTGPWGMNPGAIHLVIQDEEGRFAVEFDIVDTMEVIELYMSPDYLFPGCWYHVACTFSNSSQVRLYIDGALNSELSDLNCAPAVIGYANIGAWDDGSFLQRFVDAVIDDVRIYNRVLDPCEISELAGTRAGLTGYWKFDETSDSTAYDLSGNNIDAQVYGGTWEPAGHIDGALDFDGTDDYVDTTIWSESMIGITFCMWFKSDDAGSIGDDYVAQRFITQMLDDKFGGRSRLALGINNNKLAVYWRGESTPRDNVGEGTTTLSAGQWYHAALTYNADEFNEAVRLYLNGNEEYSFLDIYIPWSETDTSVQLGRDGNDSRYFDGLLDEVRIYQRELSGTEIQAVYNQSEYCCSVSGVGGGGEIRP